MGGGSPLAVSFNTVENRTEIDFEVRIKGRKKAWGAEEPMMTSGGDRETPSREEAAAATEMDSSSAVTPAREGIIGEGLVAVVEAGEGPVAVGSIGGSLAAVGDIGDSGVARGGGGEPATSSRDVLGSGGDGTSGGGDVTGIPHTPTVEDLLAAAERAGDERREGGGDEVVTAGRVVATPVLRATAVEPRVGDSGIGASHPVPFTEGDFLDTARPRDILDTLGLDAGIREVLRGAQTPEDQTSALLLEAMLSDAGTAADTGSPEMPDLGQGEVVVIEERVTAAAEAKAYLASARPGFESGTYTPRLHFFEPTGMTGYVPARDDYPEDLLLRDRATHISSGWATAGLFDWGGAALCTLYCFLGAASRGVGDTIGGYWRVTELWAYEVLGMFPPENTCTNPSLLPRALSWSTEYRRAKERRGQVMTFRRWLDNITGVTV
ncbi:hypothetical protein RHMOL_Rhmol05G0149900 [Rhododendron molle]|uniref:Uncharacterized protein n=1 Tax=Rhododendron molle TaxID=49168 RepID=A0ACC0NPB5_RHOML|nr:hypothetical protein RHMOL_Rhmol05G0149900 [Rhododendron molle]